MNCEYHRLRPKELVERRKTMPVAYLGLGVLEWHGFHNPLGLDGLKANGIALHLAERLGGVVMPPLYWGDNRQEIGELVFDPAASPWLPEGMEDHTGAIMAAMDADKTAYQADAARSRENGGWRLWQELVVHMLFQIQTLGFKLIVLVPGHYPLIGPLDQAVATYEQKGGVSEIFVLTDMMYSEDNDAGDHAAAFETSLMMAIAPELVKLDALDPDPSLTPIGVLGEDPRTSASQAFGEQILAKLVELAGERIQQTTN
ncbi:MAG: creatininase family protein [Chloroflexi bacterium]|nr:creatininase family protein [Chloroflexota bacterium]